MVVEIVIRSGLITSSKILESADAGMAEAVSVALKNWRFRPATRNGTKVDIPIVGRLIFYFMNVDGRPTVIDAAAAALADMKRDERGNQH